VSTVPTNGEIDRLGERLRRGPPSEADVALLDSWRASFLAAGEEVVNRVSELGSWSVADRFGKTTAAIIENLQRQPSLQLSQMQDVAGIRLIVANRIEQDHVSIVLSAAFPGSTKRDRRQEPSFGYRAVHLMVKVLGRRVEIQIRTELQQQWAQWSEGLAVRHGLGVKYGAGPEDVQRLLLSTSVLLGLIETYEVERHGLQMAFAEGNESTYLLEQSKELEEKLRLAKEEFTIAITQTEIADTHGPS
jgi:putative GTP pyrophosphokinase